MLHVLSGNTKPEEYKVSHEVAKNIPEFSLISYSSYIYAPGEQGEQDDIVLRELTSNGVVLNAIDLTEEVHLWPVEEELTAVGFHRGTVDAIDSVRLLTTDDTSAYVDPVSSTKVIYVQYNPDNASKRFETIEHSDINYGDEIYYYSTYDNDQTK